MLGLRSHALTAILMSLFLIRCGQAKDTKQPEFVFAWGKPVGALQAGLRCKAHQQVAVGDVPTEVEVVVRNIGDGPIELNYLPPESYGYGDPQHSVVRVTAIYLGAAERKLVTVRPDQLHRVGTLHFGHHRPKSNSASDPRPFWIDLGKGEFHVGTENVLASDGKLAPRLDTGFLDISVFP